MGKTEPEHHHLFKKDSEMWHAKALHTSSVFLPSDCPLVSHVTSSYCKHHLNPKIEERKKIHEEMLLNAPKPKPVTPVEEDVVVPDERKKDDFKKLRQLFKGHKISEPNFGDRSKQVKNSKVSMSKMAAHKSNSKKTAKNLLNRS